MILELEVRSTGPWGIGKHGCWSRKGRQCRSSHTCCEGKCLPLHLQKMDFQQLQCQHLPENLLVSWCLEKVPKIFSQSGGIYMVMNPMLQSVKIHQKATNPSFAEAIVQPPKLTEHLVPVQVGRDVRLRNVRHLVRTSRIGGLKATGKSPNKTERGCRADNKNLETPQARSRKSAFHWRNDLLNYD